MWLTRWMMVLCLGCVTTGDAAPFVAPVDVSKRVDLGNERHIEVREDGVIEWNLPQGKGETILIDLAAQGIDPADYDEIRFDVKPVVGHLFMNWVVHGHLGEGEIGSWYHKFQTPMGEWTEGRYSLHIDDDGAYLSRGGNPHPEIETWLKITVAPRVLGYPGEPKERRFLFRNIRLVRNRVRAGFDLAETELQEDTAEIAYVYPLHITNQTAAPLDLRLDLDTDERLHYFSAEAPSELRLEPREGRTVPVRVSIERHKAMALAPLYSEPLFIRLRVPGVEDADVVPLLGYRRWPMWGTVPVFNDHAWRPVEFQAYVAGRLGGMPGIASWTNDVLRQAEGTLRHDWPIPDFGPPVSTLEYRCGDCKVWMKPSSVTALRSHTCPKCGKVVDDNERLDRSYLPRYYGGRGGDIENLALAWLLTDDARYAEKAKKMLLDFAEAYPTLPMVGKRSTATCARLGMTTLHASYSIPSYAHGYYYLQTAPCMDDASLDQIRDFVLATGFTVCRHSVEYGNQQSEHLKAYGTVGLATRFWPMAAEAVHGEFGYHEVVEYGFTEDGIAHEAGAYHRASFGALNGLAEFAWELGINLYTPRFKRVFTGSKQAGLGGAHYELAYRVYRDPTYLSNLPARDAKRLPKVSVLNGILGVPNADRMDVRSSHMEGAGYIYLRKGTAADNRQIRLNYISQFDRSEYDRLTTFFFRNGQQVDGTVGRMGYAVPHSAWMYATAAHNCIVIDGANEDATPGRLIAYDPSPDAPIAVVGSDPERPLYDGVNQVRCIALLGNLYVVFDSVAADRPRTIDRYQYGKGRPSLRIETVQDIADLPHLPEHGQFRGIQGGACGRELRIDFSGGLKMRLVADGDMQAYKAITMGGYQGTPMETTFARRADATHAAFLAAFTVGKDSEPGALKLLDSTVTTPAFEVQDGEQRWVVRIDTAAGRVTVEIPE